MVKIKKEVWEEVCDFCEEPKTGVCSICGKDLCGVHTLGLEKGYNKEAIAGRSSFYGIIYLGNGVVSSFCPDHLGLELTNKYNDSCKGSKKNE